MDCIQGGGLGAKHTPSLKNCSKPGWPLNKIGGGGGCGDHGTYGDLER